MNCTACKRRIGSNLLECERCLDYVNWTCLMVTPVGTETDISHNQAHAGDNTLKFIQNKFVDELDLQNHYIFMKRLEAMAAAASIAYNARKIKAQIPNPSKIEKSKEWNEAIRKQREEQRPQKERKILSQRDKAIESLVGVMVKTGMPEETARQLATTQVDKSMSEVGRNVGETRI